MASLANARQPNFNKPAILNDSDDSSHKTFIFTT